MKNYTWKQIVVCVALITQLVLTGCSQGAKTKNTNQAASDTNKKIAGDSAWTYKKNIREPLKAVAGDTETTLGNLEENRVAVKIPGKTFDSKTNVTVENPKDVPKVFSKQFKPIDAPIEIKANGKDKSVRLNEPVTITMKVDKNQLEKNIDKGSVMVAYYDGNTWEYIKPTGFDLEAGTLTFNTFHFSFLGYGKVSVEEQIKQYTHNKSLAEIIQSDVDDKVDEAAEQVIDHILKDKMGIKDESTKLKVLKSMLSDGDYKDLYNKFKEGDVAGFNKTLQVFAGKKIAENVSESAIQKALGTLTSDSGVEYVEKISEAAGYIAEGRIKDAAKIIGEKIADEFVITKIGKAAVEAVAYEIDVWKNSEVDAAYKAYKDGADGYFWGYNNDPKDFKAVWDQMRGIRRQLELEAIRKQNEIREEAGQPPLTEKEMDKIRTKVMKDVEKQFKDRAENEDEIAKKEKELNELIEAYKKANLLETNRFGYSSAYDTLETRLDKLFHLRDKILRDTGRTQLTKSAFTNDKALSVGDLITLSQLWYSSNGRAEYAKYLKDKMGIDIYPQANDLGGKWDKGTFVITEFHAPDSKSGGGASSSKGCDFNEAIEKTLAEMKNKPLPSTVDMKISPDGSGSMGFSFEGVDGKTQKLDPMAFKYADGLINASVKKNDGTMTMNGETFKTADGYSMEGTWEFKMPNGAYIRGKWSSSKTK
jgi:hypothetical protein